jgi:hypothetical protein
MMRSLRFVSLLALLAACTPAGPLAFIAAPTPSPSPSSSPAPGALVVSPSTVTLTILGAAGEQSVSVSQSGYSGSFSESDNCSGVATITNTNMSGVATYAVEALASGSCTATFTGGGSRTATLGITTAISGSIAASPSPLNFYATGAAAATTLTVTQPAYSGAFGESDTCAGIETIAQQTNANGSATYLVTPVGPGTCKIVLSGGSAQSFTLDTAVTITTIGVYARHGGV